MKAAEVCPNRAYAAVETGLEASCADDMPEVYKISMMRMFLKETDEIANVQIDS